jgi:hypothetical protein
MKVSSGAECEDDPTAGDEGLTSMLDLARGEEQLLDEQNDTTLLTLLTNLLILPANTSTRKKQLV